MAAVCDLVVLTWNNPELVIPCIERLLKHTTLPARLLIVDNGSTDARTLAYVDQVRGTPWVNVTVVKRSRNDGYVVGMNDGLAWTSAPWVCLLNHDVLVTEGWLQEMLRVAETDASIGLVNPMSNEFSLGPRRPGETIDRFARSLRRYRGQWLEHYVGVGFCLLISRRVIERIGGLDEGFGFMYYEDQDYSVRARQAGFVCAVARGAYVYHHKRSGLALEARLTQLLENEARFYQKWQLGPPRRIAWVLSDDYRERAEETRARIRDLANEGHKIWVFTTRRSHRCVPAHYQVIARPLPPLLAMWWVCAQVLMKKKPFHRIVVCHRRLGRMLQALQALHRAQVIVQAG